MSLNLFRKLRGESMLKEITRDKVLKVLITILLLQLPFLDMLRTTTFKDIEVFGIALIELLNIVLIGVSLIITFTKVKLRDVFKYIGFIVIVGIYIVLHYFNIIKFDTNIFPKASFNFVTETFYILRVYVLPLTLLYVLFYNRKIFNKEYYFKIVKWLIGIISFSIIALNILKLSYISYSAKHNHVLYNIFDYFLYHGDYKQLSSRGFFDSANELSAILFMLMPINIYLLYKENKKINVVLYVCQYIAMVLLGTRTAAYGTLLISVVALGAYALLVWLKKEKSKETFNVNFVVALLACTAFLTISPFMFGRMNDGTPDFSIKDQAAYTDLENVDIKDLDKLIEKYKSEYLINDSYLKMYPLKGDPEFWLAMAKRDKALNNDNRRMKIDIINRIEERNDNPMDKWLGMGYTLDFMDLERDYIYQYYIFGIIGLLLLIGPYFVLLIYLAIKGFRSFNKNFKFITILGCMSVLLGLVIAYYSGHVFGWVSPMMYLVMFLALLICIIYDNCETEKVEKSKKNKKKVKA